MKIESDFLKLGLFSPRRQGNQLNLGIIAGTLLAALFTVLVFFAFNDVRGEAAEGSATWRNILLAVGGLATVVGVLTILRAITTGIRAIAMEVWIRRMGEGDLDYKVPMEGEDEITAIADSLEELRQRSIRVVRLNLVEKLASDLQAKNDELEEVLAQLHQAQDQIVTRQKLAELGELTAGVAHEIKNPLNFMRNFSEATDELLVELKEAIEELDDEDRKAVGQIVDDIAANLMRIEAHGLRADRIVNDMLSLGGSGGKFESTDINEIVSLFASLANNGSKAMHPDLELVIQEDLDPNAGKITAIAEDIGRVVLNMVNNSCYATDEKRLAAGDGYEDYLPMVWLQTERKQDCFEIRVRDNGTGIEPDIMGKIFNPFFTTKPTDKGTGLGLSLANEIIREHGGTIESKSQPSEYTEMVVSIPIIKPDEPGIEPDRDDKENDR